MTSEKRRVRAKPHSAGASARKPAAHSLEQLHSAMPLLVFAVDRDHVVCLIQPASPELDAQPGQFLGQPAQALGDWLQVAGLSECVQRALDGEVQTLRLHRPDLALGLRLTPVLDVSGAVTAALGVVLNVSDAGPGETSDSRLIEAFDNIEDGYFEVDLRGGFTLVNEGLCRIVGRTRNELLGGPDSTFRALIDPESADKAEQAFNHVFRTGAPLRALESRTRRPDGTLTVVEMSVSLRHDAYGRPIGFHGLVRDVTARKSVEEALAQRMVLLSVLQQVDNELNQTLEVDKVLLVGLNAAMLLTRADVGFIGLAEAERMRIVRSAGLPEHYPVGSFYPYGQGVAGRAMELRQAQFVPDVALDPDYWADVPGTRAEIAVPLLIHDRSLGTLVLESRQRNVFTEEIFEFVLTLTARIAAAIDNARLFEQNDRQLQEMRDLYAQVTELEQLKTDMIRIASHDLRSPLGIIVGYLDILTFDLDSVMSAEQRGYFDAMRRAAERIQRMSTEILSLERVTSLRSQHRLPTSLNELVLRAIVAQRDAARRGDINLITQVETSGPLTVLADATNLSEAIDNLISNAIKYTPPGGFVTVRLTRADGDTASLDVIDTGLGIRAESQVQLFEPFYRVKSEETARIDGTGLGLYLVKRIIEQHGGQLRFSSTYGQGSSFGFSLPLAADAPA